MTPERQRMCHHLIALAHLGHAGAGCRDRPGRLRPERDEQFRPLSIREGPTKIAPPTRRALLPYQTTRDGAFMEPRGCNRWQSAANRLSAETAETRQNRCRGLRPVA